MPMVQQWLKCEREGDGMKEKAHLKWLSHYSQAGGGGVS